jgi:hypothetical protein
MASLGVTPSRLRPPARAIDNSGDHVQVNAGRRLHVSSRDQRGERIDLVRTEWLIDDHVQVDVAPARDEVIHRQ